MSVFSLTDARIFVGGYDLSTDHSALALGITYDEHDVSAFGGGGYRSRIAGLGSIDLTGQGWQDFADDNPDDVLNALLGTSEVMTICPTTGADGERAFAFQGVTFDYVPLDGAVGDPAKFSFSAKGKTVATQGTVLHPYSEAETATGVGTGRQLGAGTGKTVYAALHVISASASDTLDVIVQTDNGAGFASPTTLITFAQATAVGAQFLSATGNGDDYYRVSFTIGGAATSFNFVCVVGLK